MQSIQLTKEQETELQTMTRPITPAEETALNQAYVELDKKGFIQSGENYMVLLRAYQAAPQVPITVQNVLDFTSKYHDAFEWLSAAEVEFNKLSAQLGPATTGVVIKELGRHGLVNTAGTEDLFNNFNSVVRYYLSQGWTITADSFTNAIGNLRTSLNHGPLIYKPTPDQLARQKHWDDTRTKSSTKTARQIAEAKAASVRHVMTPEGRRLSDVIMEELYTNHPEALEPETPATPPPVEEAYEGYWKRQTEEYIQHIASNNIRVEADAEVKRVYDQQKSWRAAYSFLHNWYGMRAPGRPQR